MFCSSVIPNEGSVYVYELYEKCSVHFASAILSLANIVFFPSFANVIKYKITSSKTHIIMPIRDRIMN